LLYEEEFNKIVDNLSKIIEPILIVFVGGII
jgi:type II secretory pathway component PulF